MIPEDQIRQNLINIYHEQSCLEQSDTKTEKDKKRIARLKEIEASLTVYLVKIKLGVLKCDD